MRCPECSVEFATASRLEGHVAELTLRWRTYEYRVSEFAVPVPGSEHDYLVMLDHVGAYSGLGSRSDAEVDTLARESFQRLCAEVA